MAENLGDLEVALRANTASWEAGFARATMVTTSFANRTMAPLVNVAAMFRTVGVVMFGVGAAGAFALSKMIKPAMDFQDQLSQVATMVDDTGKHMSDFTTGLSDMAIRFGESTEILSKGLYDILSATIAPAEALGVLEVAARAAAGGMTDTGTAADAITTILNAYQLAASEAADVSDLLFAIVRRGKLTFADLAPSIGRVAASAALAGLPMEELGAAIATITRAGIPTRIAVTSLNSVIKNFMAPTEDAQAAARKLGIVLSTATLRAKGLTGVLVMLAGLQPDLVARIFPNVRALRAMAAILQGATGYAYDYQIMLNRTGMAMEAFEKRTTTLTYAFERLKQAGLALVRAIGTALIPELTDLANVATAISKALHALGPSTAKTLSWIAAITPVVAMLGGAFLLLLGPLMKVAIFLTTVMIPAFIAMAMTPVGLIVILLSLVAAIFGGISAFKMLSSMLDEVKKALDELTGKTGKAVDKTVDLGKSVTDLIADYKALIEKTKTLGTETEEYKETQEELLEIAKRLGPEVMLLTDEFNNERISVENLNEALSIHFELIKQRVEYEEAQRKIDGFTGAIDRMQAHLLEIQTAPVLREGFWAEVVRGLEATGSAIAGFLWSPEWQKGAALTEEAQKDIIARLEETIKLAEARVEVFKEEREAIAEKIALTEAEIQKQKEFERISREFHDLVMGWLTDERMKKELAVEDDYKRFKEGGLEKTEIEIAGVKTSVSLEEWRSIRLLEIRTKSMAQLAAVEEKMLEGAKGKRIGALLEEFRALEKFGVLRMDRRREIAEEIFEYAKEETEKLAELGAEHGRSELRVILDIIGYWKSWKDVMMTITDDWYGFLMQREEEIRKIYRRAAGERRATEDAEYAYQRLIGAKTLEEEIARLEVQSRNFILSVDERNKVLTKLFQKRKELADLGAAYELKMLELRRARNEVTLSDEIDIQEGIVEATEKGTIKRIEAEIKLEELRTQYADERRTEEEAWFAFHREHGSKTLQDEIDWLEEILLEEELTGTARRDLLDQILTKKKELAKEEREIADAQAAYLREIGEETLQDEVERLYERLRVEKMTDLARWELRLEIVGKEKQIAEERLELLRQWYTYQKALGEQTLEDEIALLQKRLDEEELSELEYLAILTEVAEKESELKETQKAYEEALLEYRRLIGEATLADAVEFWRGRLAAADKGTTEYINLETKIYNLEKQRRDEEQAGWDSSVRASKEAMYAKAQQAVDYWNIMGHGREAEILEAKITQEQLLDAVVERLQAETKDYKLSSQAYVQWTKWAGEQRALIEQQTVDKIAEVDKKYGATEMKQAEARLDYAVSMGQQTYKVKIEFLEWYLAGLRKGTDEEKQMRTDILRLAERLGGDELRIYDEMARVGHEVRRELIGATLEYGDEELSVLKKLKDAVEEYVDFEISEVGELPAFWWNVGKARLEATRTWLQENYEEHVNLEKKINKAVKEGTAEYIAHVKERLDQELALSELSKERQYELLIDFYDRQIKEAEKAADFDEEAYRKLVYEKALLEKEFSDYRKDLEEDMYEYLRLTGEKTLEEEIARINGQLATEVMSIEERIKLLTRLFNLSKQLVKEREELATAQFEFEQTVGTATLKGAVERQAEMLTAYREAGREKIEIINRQLDLYKSLVALEEELTEAALKRGATNVEIAAIQEQIWAEYYVTLTGSMEGFADFVARRWADLIDNMHLVGDTMEERWNLALERMRARIENWFTQIHPIFDALGEAVGGFVSEFADAFTETLIVMIKQTEDMEEVWQKMWQRLVAYALDQLLKLLAWKIVTWFLGLIGLKGGGEVKGSAGAGAPSMEVGGPVAQAEAIIAQYARSMQKGGEVLIRAHVGEFMIPEWMTSFIKRTGSIPGELVNAIVAGRPPKQMQAGGEVAPGAVSAANTWTVNFLPGSRFTEADKASTRAWFENEIWPLQRELQRRE